MMSLTQAADVARDRAQGKFPAAADHSRLRRSDESVTKSTLGAAFRRACVIGLLTSVYSSALALSAALRRFRHSALPPIRRIAATARFDSDNWFRAHFLPLTQCGLDDVVFVSERGCEAGAVRSPPPWLTRIVGRAGAKLITLFAVGAARRADLFIGYHFFPGAISALIVARLMGRRACYQMTGGPTEVVGGGFGAENPILASLNSPSRFLERLALRLVREFDLIVVRGEKAKAFLQSHGVDRPIVCVPGSVAAEARDHTLRDIDLVFVGRLSEIKQPLQFIELVSMIRLTRPELRAAVIGDGPLQAPCQAAARRLGVEACIEFLGSRDGVVSILSRAKVFVLTSRSEGLSIALAEAMAAGAVPVAPDVGDLSTLVQDGETGYLVPPGDLHSFARCVERILADRQLWNRLSSHALAAAHRHCSVAAVAAQWRRALSSI